MLMMNVKHTRAKASLVSTAHSRDLAEENRTRQIHTQNLTECSHQPRCANVYQRFQYTQYIYFENIILNYFMVEHINQDRTKCFVLVVHSWCQFVPWRTHVPACLPETYHHQYQYQCHCLVGRLAAGRTAVDEFRVSDLCITLIFPWLDFVAAFNLFFSFWTTFPVTLSNSI